MAILDNKRDGIEMIQAASEQNVSVTLTGLGEGDTYCHFVWSKFSGTGTRISERVSLEHGVNELSRGHLHANHEATMVLDDYPVGTSYTNHEANDNLWRVSGHGAATAPIYDHMRRWREREREKLRERHTERERKARTHAEMNNMLF